METLLLTMAVGALIGFCTGLLLNGVVSWCKDRRDTGLRKQGLPLPSDRVPAKYHWLFLILGLLAGVMVFWQSFD